MDKNNPQNSSELFIPWNKKTKFILAILLLIPIVLVAVGSVWYYQNKISLQAVVSVADQSPKAQLEETLKLVSKIAILPQNDEPTLAVVSDPAQLKGDAFFANAIVGDRVLIYPKIGWAVLYRPLTGQIVNMTSFALDTAQSQAHSSTTATTTLKLTH